MSETRDATDTPDDVVISGQTILEALQGILAHTTYTLDDVLPRISMIQRSPDEGGNYIAVAIQTKTLDPVHIVAQIDHEFMSVAEIQAQMNEAKAALVP